MNKKKFFLKDFDYNLPEKLIAQEPTVKRDDCRLLYLNKRNGNIRHDKFKSLLNFLQKGDVLVFNNSQVFPARLHGFKKESKGKIEILLHHCLNKNKEEFWESMIKGKVRPGLTLVFSKNLEAEVISKNEDGLCILKFNQEGEKFFKIIEKIGETPLPPYIRRDKGLLKNDQKNYQTVFANSDFKGSSAAPTAGLHFTKKMIHELEIKGVEIIYITLHVGLGTFAPVKTENMLDHKMHKEYVIIDPKTAKKLEQAKKNKKRIIPVGTTSLRAIESFYYVKNKKNSFWTDIYIYPGYKFKYSQALITNFHLPKSTLLLLVSALAKEDNIKKAYSEAILKEYRFFSYGDAMIIY